MNMRDDQTCRYCRFFSLYDKAGRGMTGTCRIAPPRTSVATRWPQVDATDFCGSFQRRDAGMDREQDAALDYVFGSAPTVDASALDLERRVV